MVLKMGASGAPACFLFFFLLFILLSLDLGFGVVFGGGWGAERWYLTLCQLCVTLRPEVNFTGGSDEDLILRKAAARLDFSGVPES